MSDPARVAAWRRFEDTLAAVRRGFADLSPEEVQALADEALAAVRQEREVPPATPRAPKGTG